MRSGSVQLRLPSQCNALCVCVSTCLVSPLCSHVLLVFSVMSPSPLCPLYVFRSLIRVSSPIVTSLFTCLVRVSYSAYFLFYFDSPVFHVRCVKFCFPCGVMFIWQLVPSVPFCVFTPSVSLCWSSDHLLSSSCLISIS